MTEEEYAKAYNDALVDVWYTIKWFHSESSKVNEAFNQLRDKIDLLKYPESLPTHVAVEPRNFDVTAFKKANRKKCTARPIILVLPDNSEYTTFVRIHSYRGSHSKKNYKFIHYYNGYLFEKSGRKYPVSEEAKKTLPKYLKLEVKNDSR